MREPTCRRCTRPAEAVVAVREANESYPTAEVPLCGRHLVDVAEACGYERPRPEAVVEESR